MMLHPLNPPTARRGASLIEAMIAVGVLAVALPLVFGTFVESGRVSMSAEAETRSGWIVPACLAEIDASRDGTTAYFTATQTGDSFPDAGEVWALGFNREGEVVGKITKSDYDTGVRPTGENPVRYIATLTATPEAEGDTPGDLRMMRTTIALEFPASAPAEKRNSLKFHTRIP